MAVTFTLTLIILLSLTKTGATDDRNITCRQNVAASNIITSSSASQRHVTYSKHTCCAMGLERESLTFFYNSLTNVCQLDKVSVDVSPGTNVINEQGWQMYILRGKTNSTVAYHVTGKYSLAEEFPPIKQEITCPATFVFNQALSICYRIYDPEPGFSVYDDYKNKCGEDEAVPFLVDSADKQNAIKNYIDQSSASFTSFVIVQGQRIGTNFLDDNGNALGYANWDVGQPGASELYIGVGTIFSYKWHDITWELNSSNFICEIKL